MNRKIEKQIRKKGKKKRFYLSIFAFIMLLFVPVFVYASEMKSDGKTTQVIEEENKTVRVGYFPYSNFQEGSYGEHKQGAGYEYSTDNRRQKRLYGYAAAGGPAGGYD